MDETKIETPNAVMGANGWTEQCLVGGITRVSVVITHEIESSESPAQSLFYGFITRVV